MNLSELPDFRGTFTGQIKAGQFIPSEPGRWSGWLMKHNGKPVTVIVSRVKHRRTLAQNARYWSLIVPCFSEWSGYETDEAHELLKGMFLKQEVSLPSGELVERVRSTTELSTAEHTEYCRKVETFLAQHGFGFPEDME